MAQVKIGSKVRLTQDVENYPTCLIKAGETGTLAAIDNEGAYWVHLDVHHDELEEWENQVQIWDWSLTNDGEHSPETYLEALSQ